MSPSPLPQTIGNVCVGIVGFIYLLPLQVLLFELAHKRSDHGQGTIVGFFLIVPLWLLLLTALCCVIASGGFDGLRFARGWLYAFAVGATLAMLALSFMPFEFPRHPNFLTRWSARVPVYIFPAATLLLVLLHLNPRLAPGTPLPPVKLTWLVCAGLSLLLCGGFLGYRFAGLRIGRVGSLGNRFTQRGPADRDIIAKIATLDPQRDFTELLQRAGQGESRAVREAATVRLRQNPNFVASLAAALTSRDADSALGFLAAATLSVDEQARLALPARTAMERFIDDIPAPNYMSSDRRKELLRWGRKTFPAIAEKFSATDVDFKPTLAAFEHALRPDDTRRR